MANYLFYGDNLGYLREMDRESVDLIYLDPPFNSKSNYNLLFRSPRGGDVQAQTTAFKDTWTWDTPAEFAFDQVLASGSPVTGMIRAFRTFLGESDMMAYIAMMTPRLIELYRVLKSTGSLYLHCDPTASHYLKLVLDGIFGPSSFRNEIVWKRTSAHSSAKRCGPVHDIIFFYSKTDSYTWNPLYQIYDEDYITDRFKRGEEKPWKDADLTGSGIRNGETGQEWRGFNPTHKGRHWAYPPSQLDQMDTQGLIYWPTKQYGWPRKRVFLDQAKGIPLQDLWTDISPINSQAQERLGYPTQKPLALLRRIIASSSNEGDVVLDPFCGCGTTIEAAQDSRRDWIGIDITHHAIDVIEGRLRARFPNTKCQVTGRPVDIGSAQRLAEREPYEFQWWANWMLGVQNYQEKKKGADKGIDGIIYFHNVPHGVGQIIVSVKAGLNIGPDMIDALSGTVTRERAELGVFVCVGKPTEKMRQRAAAQGLVRVGRDQFQKIQIVTAEDLLSDRAPHLPKAIESDAFVQPLRSVRPVKIVTPQPQLTLALPIMGGKAARSGIQEHLSGRIIGSRAMAATR